MKYTYTFNRHIKFLIVLLLMSGFTSSCGFHLRGEITVPDIMKELYVGGNYSSNELGTVLFRRLQQLGITRKNKPKESSAKLLITNNNFTRRVLTVDAATKASAYKLDLVVSFQVIDPKDKVIIKNQQIRQTREYNIDPLNALASGDQENRLKTEMIEFIVSQMLTRISIVLKNSS